jgi:hypothetical protein
MAALPDFRGKRVPAGKGLPHGDCEVQQALEPAPLASVERIGLRERKDVAS